MIETLKLTVTDVVARTPIVREIVLARPDGGPLPSWEPGAHVKILLPQGGDRSYSLINATPAPGATTRPHAYRLGVRLETPSTGGSAYMHDLKPGDTVAVAPPQNNFPLEPAEGPIVLVAGGIGVTPILSMAAELAAAGHPFRFHFAGRRRADLAFLAEVEAVAGPALAVHADDEAGGFFDVKGLMAGLGPSEQLYLCGPLPMIEAARDAAKALGWRDGRLRFEIFAAVTPKAGDGAFEVVLKSSGKSFTVPPDKTILDVLIEAGEDPLHDCRRGDCGICQVGVVEGEPDHRDFILTESERASNTLMQICISRSKTPRLVLDL